MKLHSEPIEEHDEVPLADEGRWEAAVAHWRSRETPQRAIGEQGNACYVLSLFKPEDEPSANAQLEEIVGLVEAQGDRVVAKRSHVLIHPDPRTLIRRGLAADVGDEAKELGADLLVVDADLNPSQARNLEDATGLAVSDREAVILNVFERNARTRRARVQVEIAHLEYLRPRIRGIGLNMDQQAGGLMAARGPGETASELLARRLDGRLAELRRRLIILQRSETAQRKGRDRCARVVLVGYTNAGKTSLMNALTSSELSARDRPFETLDSTARALSRHGKDVVLSDTVGFIRRLPDRLLASFESTLAEVREASLILVVVDVSDPEAKAHLETTERVLERLGAAAIARHILFNKADRLDEPADPRVLRLWAGEHNYSVVSSREPHLVAGLRETILAAARSKQRTKQIYVPYEHAELQKAIHARCRVVRSVAAPGGMQYDVQAEKHELDALFASLRATRAEKDRR